MALVRVLLGTIPASAEPPTTAVEQEARERFESGRSAYQAGHYELALSEFTRSYELSQRPQLQYNLGLAYDRLRRDGEALDAFESYLAWDPNADRAVEVRARVAALKRAIGNRMVVPPTTTDAPHHVVDDSLEGDENRREGDARASDDDRGRRKRRRWIAGVTAIAVAALGAGLAVVLARKSTDEHSREPNTGIRVEALSWH